MAGKLQPYLFFYGRCEEALNFYKDVFGGRCEIVRIGETPMVRHMPDAAQRVMHASFIADDIAFLASDGQHVKTIDTNAGNISLALAFDNAARGERVFYGLAQGGDIWIPIEQAYWGGRFGIVTDKFGTEWMVTLP